MKKTLLLIAIICCSVLPAFGAFPVGGATQTNYCFVPPYLTQNVKPNLHLTLDFSGSMQFPAYLPCSFTGYTSSVAECGTSTSATFKYKTTKNYYGNFKEDVYYKYNTGSGYFEENAACVNTDRKGTFASGCLSGNLLNWITTTRLDVSRKVLTGGRVKSGFTDVLESEGSKYIYTDTTLGCKFTVSAASPLTRKIKVENQPTCEIGTTGGSTYNMDVQIIDPATYITGIIQSIYSDTPTLRSVDLELSVYNGTVNTKYSVGKNKLLSQYLDAINTEPADNGTPTGEAMREAKYYFQQSNSMTATNEANVIGVGDYTKDPYYEGASLAAPCKNAFVLLISDGEWNGSIDPVSQVYTMHTTDLRSDAALPDKQIVTTYAVYAFGDSLAGQQSMKTIAIYGGFDDKSGNNWPYPFTALPADSRSVSYPRTECNILTANSTTSTTIGVGSKTFTVEPSLAIINGKTVNIVFNDPDTVGLSYDFSMSGTVTSYNSTTGALTVNINSVSGAGTLDQWKVFVVNRFDTGCAEWDPKMTGSPYNYFEASDGTVLKRQIMGALNSMFAKASSGTAASMLGNSDSSGAMMLQALFYPSKTFASGQKVNWFGEVQAYWYFIDSSLNSSLMSLREDTVQDAKLRLSEDNIAQFFFNGTDTKVNLFSDLNSDGVADGLVSTENPEDVRAIWRAGLTLWSRLPTGASGRAVYTNNLSSTPTSNNLMSFGTANLALLNPKLDVASVAADSTNVINYTLGKEPPHVDLSVDEQDPLLAGFRARTVKLTTGASSYETHAWKLGDIINSTPRMLSSNPLNLYSSKSPSGYNDKSYARFTATLDYKNRGVAFVGGNDGMLHAFKLGKNIAGAASSGFVSSVVNSTDIYGNNPVAATDLGKELWAYIPTNVLPYLKHRGNPDYAHMFYVDATPTLIDASIAYGTNICSGDASRSCATSSDCTGSQTCVASPACSGSDCPKTDKSWRSVLIGSMGLGGATRNQGSVCTDCVKTPIADVGYSSYFALDVTNPASPALLWEFSHPRLGYSTVGPTIVRIKDATDTIANTKNGKFYAVLASGPTGPIDTSYKQMKAYSDQPLALFVLDLKSGSVVKTFSNDCSGLTNCTVTASMPSNAFGGTFSNSTIDTDKIRITDTGFYSDDAIYLGYVRKGVTGDTPAAAIGKYAKGGVLRVLTGDNPDPSTWRISKVIDGIGPVTSSIAKLQDTTNGNLWLYFGTGRYFFKNGAVVDEDYTDQQEAIYGIQEPCYVAASNELNFAGSCTTARTVAELKDQTTVGAMGANRGWMIKLATASGSFKAKRVYTNPTATTIGVLYFTSFKPSSEVCGFGGDTSIWAVEYSTGGSVSSYKIKGQAVVQLGSGELKQINLATDFTNSGNRETDSFKGPPSKDEIQIISNANHFPSKKIMHIMER